MFLTPDVASPARGVLEVNCRGYGQGPTEWATSMGCTHALSVDAIRRRGRFLCGR